MKPTNDKNMIKGKKESHEIKQESLDSPYSDNKSYNNNNKNATNKKEQDRFLPVANVGRIMKKIIPPNGKVSKDAKETVQECVSEFISFVTGEASDKCQREKRKTINGDDIIWAITNLGFEDYVHPLKVYLNKYRDIEGEKLNLPKQQQRLSIEHQLHHISNQHQPHNLHHQRLLSHHHHQQHQHDQFQQVNQGLSPFTTSVYSSHNTLLLPPPSFSEPEQSFPLTFSPTSMQKSYQHQEQMDRVGH